MSDKRKKIGNAGEQQAADYLSQNGCSILARQYRTPYGEIDIIAEDHGALCFVEVKTRTSQAYGNPAESITPLKQARIAHTAQHYLNSLSPEASYAETRFDLMVVESSDENPYPKITWIKGAFYV